MNDRPELYKPPSLIVPEHVVNEMETRERAQVAMAPVRTPQAFAAPAPPNNQSKAFQKYLHGSERQLKLRRKGKR